MTKRSVTSRTTLTVRGCVGILNVLVEGFSGLRNDGMSDTVCGEITSFKFTVSDT